MKISVEESMSRPVSAWDGKQCEITLKWKHEQKNKKKKITRETFFGFLPSKHHLILLVVLEFVSIIRCWFVYIYLTLLLIHKLFRSFPRRWLQSRRKFIGIRHKYTRNEGNEFKFASIPIHLPQLCCRNTF